MVLRKDTAVDVLIGPFVDLANGYTAEAGETPAVLLSVNGEALGAKSHATVPDYDDAGYYNCQLDTTDTATVGTMVLVVEETATARAIRHEYTVVEETTYDALYKLAATGFTTLGEINLIAATQTSVDAIEADATLILADTGTTLDGKLDSIIAEVVTAQALPGKSAPPLTSNIADAIMWLYKAYRNKETQSATLYQLLADDGSTVDTTAAITDDGTTLTYNKKAAGA